MGAVITWATYFGSWNYRCPYMLLIFLPLSPLDYLDSTNMLNISAPSFAYLSTPSLYFFASVHVGHSALILTALVSQYKLLIAIPNFKSPGRRKQLTRISEITPPRNPCHCPLMLYGTLLLQPKLHSWLSSLDDFYSNKWLPVSSCPWFLVSVLSLPVDHTWPCLPSVLSSYAIRSDHLFLLPTTEVYSLVCPSEDLTSPVTAPAYKANSICFNI